MRLFSYSVSRRRFVVLITFLSVNVEFVCFCSAGRCEFPDVLRLPGRSEGGARGWALDSGASGSRFAADAARHVLLVTGK